MKPIETYFAPAARLSAPEMRRQRGLLDTRPIIREILNALPDPAVVLNEQRQIIAANSNFTGALKLESDEPILGERVGDLLGCIRAHEGPAGCGTSEFCPCCGAIQAVMESRATNRKTAKEARVTIKAGAAETAMDVLATVSPLQIPGTEVFSLVTLTDISHEKRRKALERIFFHDVLNTIGGLKGFLQCIRPGEVPTTDRELLENAIDITEVLISEIQSHRDLLSAEQQELKVTFRRVKSFEVLKETVQRFGLHLVARDKLLEVDADSDDVEFDTVEVLLSRVLINLLKNACEASQEGGRVRISCRSGQGSVYYTVHNEGVMSEPVRQQIFQRSFSTKGSGRGLGTYGLKLLTERYLGGKVSFTSAEGQGTSFVIKIPLERKAQA